MLNEQFDLAHQLATSTHSNSSMGQIIGDMLRSARDDIDDESESETTTNRCGVVLVPADPQTRIETSKVHIAAQLPTTSMGQILFITKPTLTDAGIGGPAIPERERKGNPPFSLPELYRRGWRSPKLYAFF